MGNFWVNGIAETGANGCSTMLLDILKSTPRYESASLFGHTGYGTQYLETADNIFSHPFVNSSAGYTIIDYDPFMNKINMPSIESATALSTGSSSGSSFFNDYILEPLNDFIPWVKSTFGSGYRTIKETATGVANYVSGFFGRLVDFAKSFVGRVNNDREGNRLFSGGRNRAWCADFVTYCVRQTLGSKLPSDFGSAAVSGLRDWGKNHGCYFEAPFTQGLTAMRNFLKSRVKPGDIMIEKRNGKSHTGIVTYVDPDGRFFKTVEGNASNSVKERTYQADSKTLSGFVSLANYA